MTAAFDARSIVKAQHTLSAVAYGSKPYKGRNKKQQQKIDDIIAAISQDIVMVDAITLAGSTSYLAGTKPTELAANWERVAKQKLVGSGIAASILWSLFYQWVLPMLLEWAREWLKQQQLAAVSVTTRGVNG